MNFKSLLLSVLSVFALTNVIAQANILNAKSPDEIGVKSELRILIDNDEPLEYGYVDDRDILYSRMTWEKVALDERVNFPLYYPVDTNNIGKDRRSLYDVLIKNIKNGNIKAMYDDSYFTAQRTFDDIKDAISKTDTLEIGYDQLNADGYVDEEYIVRREISSYDISAYLIKGLWYFDKRQAELKFRILGLAPAAPDVNFIDSDDEANKAPIPLFWIFFPDARDVLHKAMSFNNKNSAMPISYDHLLNARRFNGYVYREENVQGDRSVKDYISDNALMQLIESDRIKEKIRNFEQDMWSY
ncbi:MAG: gliding motility protein GldN [Flavobacteriaceae bacterium]|nr:gliding motility protein GldN [Bacteroidia bacterium]NNK83365.1 gliding motility protein GldN [Flavobacteriaceae bacterium]